MYTADTITSMVGIFYHMLHQKKQQNINILQTRKTWLTLQLQISISAPTNLDYQDFMGPRKQPRIVPQYMVQRISKGWPDNLTQNLPILVDFKILHSVLILMFTLHYTHKFLGVQCFHINLQFLYTSSCNDINLYLTAFNLVFVPKVRCLY